MRDRAEAVLEGISVVLQFVVIPLLVAELLYQVIVRHT